MSRWCWSLGLLLGAAMPVGATEFSMDLDTLQWQLTYLLQDCLGRLEYYRGPVTGTLDGPTREAVQRFVFEYNVRAEPGYVTDPKYVRHKQVLISRCREAFHERLGLFSHGARDQTRVTQFCLRHEGVYDGPIDGTDQGGGLRLAIERFSTSRDLKPGPDDSRIAVALFRECREALGLLDPPEPALKSRRCKR